MSDRIYIDIDLTALDAALDRLRDSMGMGTRGAVTEGGVLQGQTTLGGLPMSIAMKENMHNVISRRVDVLYDSKIFPSINRDVRLLLGQIPGARELMRGSFIGRRLERGIGVGGPAQYLAMGATLVLIMQMLGEVTRNIERLNKGYDQMLMQVTGADIREIRKWQEEQGDKPYKSLVPWG